MKLFAFLTNHESKISSKDEIWMIHYLLILWFHGHLFFESFKPALIIKDEILFSSGGRKTAGAPSAKTAPAPKQSPTVAGRAPLKVSDEITIIPQGKNTQAKPKVPVLVSLIWFIYRKMINKRK